MQMDESKRIENENAEVETAISTQQDETATDEEGEEATSREIDLDIKWMSTLMFKLTRKWMSKLINAREYRMMLRNGKRQKWNV